MFNFFKKIKKGDNKGFTLIEIMVSLSIFAMVMTVVASSLISISNANKKAQKLRSVVDNLNFSIEDMTRKIRTASVIKCQKTPFSGTYQTLNDEKCESPSNGSIAIWIKSQPDGTRSGDCYLYFFDETTKKVKMFRQSAGGVSLSDKTCSGSAGNSTDITSSEVDIKNLKFYVYQDSAVSGQPPVVILTLNGDFKSDDANGQSVPFNLQTTIAQRKDVF